MEYSIWGFPVFKYKFDDPDKALEEIMQNANNETLTEMSDDWNAKCTSTAQSRDEMDIKYVREELEKTLEKFSSIKLPE